SPAGRRAPADRAISGRSRSCDGGLVVRLLVLPATIRPAASVVRAGSLQTVRSRQTNKALLLHSVGAVQSSNRSMLHRTSDLYAPPPTSRHTGCLANRIVPCLSIPKDLRGEVPL